ncbi:hypothetical protein Nepgr_022058 [Nepenthes gracilis]|uniref:Uncharacterized protein n=1 Tax=Nepenthes gracilis TaxID=150966 RepID=A0AAD3XWG3_NEPGR|nr:hypothetical protein Nepgr_022058 [Nepenthes gracilis]
MEAVGSVSCSDDSATGFSKVYTELMSNARGGDGDRYRGGSAMAPDLGAKIEAVKFLDEVESTLSEDRKQVFPEYLELSPQHNVGGDDLLESFFRH